MDIARTKLGEWSEMTRESVVDCRIFSVERSIARSPADGSRHTFHRIRCTDWAQVLPITVDGDAVLVRQYRHGAQRMTLEIPAGMLDPGEDPATAALRECLEETGFRARKAISLGAVNPNPALFANRLHSFFATDVEPERSVQNTTTEFTEPVLVPVRELEGLLLDGQIEHALVAATLWRYLRLYAPR
jgi:8-oxo-dGTP pyrophosphatase MutT (NUDIX family)